MQLQRLTEELLLTVTSLNRSCIPQSVQEHLKGENFLLSYLDEHGGCSTPGVLREVLGRARRPCRARWRKRGCCAAVPTAMTGAASLCT